MQIFQKVRANLCVARPTARRHLQFQTVPSTSGQITCKCRRWWMKLPTAVNDSRVSPCDIAVIESASTISPPKVAEHHGRRNQHIPVTEFASIIERYLTLPRLGCELAGGTSQASNRAIRIRNQRWRWEAGHACRDRLAWTDG